MKRFFIVLVLLLGSFFTAFAQKQYINMVVQGWPRHDECYITLTGSVPSNVEKEYHMSDIGGLLNTLSEHGFIIEQMSCTTMGGTGSNGGYHSFCEVVILSKNASSPDQIRILESDDAEVTEMARYNLQGMPVNKRDKGMQIVVYSNYTTKVEFVQ